MVDYRWRIWYIGSQENKKFLLVAGKSHNRGKIMLTVQITHDSRNIRSVLRAIAQDINYDRADMLRAETLENYSQAAWEYKQDKALHLRMLRGLRYGPQEESWRAETARAWQDYEYACQHLCCYEQHRCQRWHQFCQYMQAAQITYSCR